eukprot:1567092-Pleurochrysis_carterae.AAC.1
MAGEERHVLRGVKRSAGSLLPSFRFVPSPPSRPGRPRRLPASGLHNGPAIARSPSRHPGEMPVPQDGEVHRGGWRDCLGAFEDDRFVLHRLRARAGGLFAAALARKPQWYVRPAAIMFASLHVCLALCLPSVLVTIAVYWCECCRSSQGPSCMRARRL